MYMSQLLTSLSVLLDVHELAVYFTFSSEKSVSHAVAVFQQPVKGVVFWHVLKSVKPPRAVFQRPVKGLCFGMH